MEGWSNDFWCPSTTMAAGPRHQRSRRSPAGATPLGPASRRRCLGTSACRRSSLGPAPHGRGVGPGASSARCPRPPSRLASPLWRSRVGIPPTTPLRPEYLGCIGDWPDGDRRRSPAHAGDCGRCVHVVGSKRTSHACAFRGGDHTCLGAARLGAARLGAATLPNSPTPGTAADSGCDVSTAA